MRCKAQRLSNSSCPTRSTCSRLPIRPPAVATTTSRHACNGSLIAGASFIRTCMIDPPACYEKCIDFRPACNQADIAVALVLASLPAGSTRRPATKSASTSSCACSTCGTPRRSGARLQSTQVGSKCVHFSRSGFWNQKHFGTKKRRLASPRFASPCLQAGSVCMPTAAHPHHTFPPAALCCVMFCAGKHSTARQIDFSCPAFPSTSRSLHLCAQPLGARHQQLEAHPQPWAAARVPPQFCALCGAALQLRRHVPGQVRKNCTLIVFS